MVLVPFIEDWYDFDWTSVYSCLSRCWFRCSVVVVVVGLAVVCALVELTKTTRMHCLFGGQRLLVSWITLRRRKKRKKKTPIIRRLPRSNPDAKYDV